MKKNRLARIDSLLKEVIAEVIMQEVRNPHVAKFSSVTKVETAADLHQANVFISVIGSSAEQAETIAALQQAASFIAREASRRMSIRHFPILLFKLDTSVEKHLRIEKILQEIKEKKQ